MGGEVLPIISVDKEGNSNRSFDCAVSRSIILLGSSNWSMGSFDWGAYSFILSRRCLNLVHSS